MVTTIAATRRLMDQAPVVDLKKKVKYTERFRTLNVIPGNIFKTISEQLLLILDNILRAY